jgi:membrane protease YdiL (CAAX protease family)
MKESSRKGLIVELTVLTLAVLVGAHVLYRLRFIAWVNEYISVLIALILLYAPVMILWKRRRAIDFIEKDFRSFLNSLGVGLIVSAIIFPPFFLAAHFWQIWVMGMSEFRMASFPIFNSMILYQLLLVALPEEFYFRGYFQSAMNSIIRPRWSFLGARLGWSWIITAVVFAIAHSIIFYQWWHFAIFFPALVFGYLRERTGSITAPIIFHALSNILINWFSRCYI